MEYTFSIIKPNAVAHNDIGEIIYRIERAGLKVIALKMLHLTNDQATEFYAEHKGKPFFDALIEFMTSGPIVAQVLSGDNAVRRYRELMGETDPNKALAGTLRAQFATSMRANAVHGSDSIQSAQREIAFFFTAHELFKR